MVEAPASIRLRARLSGLLIAWLAALVAALWATGSDILGIPRGIVTAPEEAVGFVSLVLLFPSGLVEWLDYSLQGLGFLVAWILYFLLGFTLLRTANRRVYFMGLTGLCCLLLLNVDGCSQMRFVVALTPQVLRPRVFLDT